MVRKLAFAALLVLAFSGTASAWDYLYVQDPRGWESGNGTIEEAVLSVRPEGLYAEYGLYLTLSARDVTFYNTDTVEAVFYFDLPAGSIVHDSWLWIGDEIIQAKLMDIWSASQLYEDIVRRRRDPSILYKRSDTSYELRIFPMHKNESRKVKITYLAPAQWSARSVVNPIPASLLRVSYHPLQNLPLLLWPSGEWRNPGLVEFPGVRFTTRQDPKFGDFLQADIPWEDLQGSLNLSWNAPFRNGVYLNRYAQGAEPIYQLAFLPSQALNLAEAARKVLICFDHSMYNSSLSGGEVLRIIRAAAHAHLTPADSFNVFCAGLTVRQASGEWLPADSASIEAAFNEMTSGGLTPYSNLPSLLAAGIGFIKTQGYDGNLFLVSSSDQFGDYQAANSLISDLTDLMDPVIPVHVADVQNQNQQYFYVGDRYFLGNEYFYENLARLTGGNEESIGWSGAAASDVILSVFQKLGGFVGSFDLHTSLAGGFCYGRFSADLDASSVYLNRPILQVGKYNGVFPFEIEASGVFQSAVFSEEISVPEADTHAADTTAEEIWAGNYIRSLESGPLSNDVVDEIVRVSLAERVLSLYSSFICLEPGMGGQPMTDPWDESPLPGAVEDGDETAEDDSLFQAFPNPFNTETVVSIRLKRSVDLKSLSFRVYNVLGQTVKEFEAPPSSDGRNFRFTWNGRDEAGLDVPSGTYLFVMTGAGKRQVLKLALLR
ncbi:MAG: VIT domain-containing protein [bacterium]|nr:VIT domain-containing protein [bacterium]